MAKDKMIALSKGEGVTKKSNNKTVLKVKITPMGGYVMGDGKCPFNPDDFLKLFGARIIQAQAQGLSEIGFTQEAIDGLVALEREKWTEMVDTTPVREVAYKSMEGVLE